MRKGIFLTLAGAMMLCSCGKNEEKGNIPLESESPLRVVVTGENNTTPLLKLLGEAYAGELRGFLLKEFDLSSDAVELIFADELRGEKMKRDGLCDVMVTIPEKAVREAVSGSVLSEEEK